jgi:hypothetical protein
MPSAGSGVVGLDLSLVRRGTQSAEYRQCAMCIVVHEWVHTICAHMILIFL